MDVVKETVSDVLGGGTPSSKQAIELLIAGSLVLGPAGVKRPENAAAPATATTIKSKIILFIYY